MTVCSNDGGLDEDLEVIGKSSAGGMGLYEEDKVLAGTLVDTILSRNSLIHNKRPCEIVQKEFHIL